MLTDNSPMPFGKYKGRPMVNVPADYLLWLYNQNHGQKPFGKEAQAVRDYIADNLTALKQEAREKNTWKDCDATESDIY